jgi:TonB family protein
MKIRRAAIPLPRFPWRDKTEAARDLNLLDLPQPARRSDSFLRWMLPALLILVHGGLLTYLISFARMPGQPRGTPPNAIPVELTDSVALEKQDREPIRADLSPAKGAAQDEMAHARPQAQQPVVALNVTVPPDPASALPEDMGAQPPRQAGSGAHPEAADEEQPAGTDRQEQAAQHAEQAGPAEPASREQRTERPVTPLAVARSAAFLAFHGAAHLPEDLRPLSSGDTGDAPLSDEVADAASAAIAEAVPPPARRQIAAAEIAHHEENSSNVDAETPQAARSRALNAYRVKVREHLAAHKPRGGFGSDTVVVGFTLLRSGDVASARILKSRGIYHLDQGALNAVHRAAPFPRPPQSLKGARFHFAIPFRFE